MRRIGLFGGTFNPIHIGHVKLGEAFLEQLGLDEVWFLVTPQNPWKQNQALAPDHVRLAIVEKALEDNPRLVASDYEFSLPRPSYTYQTLRRLREERSDAEFMLLIGADNWVKFSAWMEHEEILAFHPIAVYPREGCQIDPETLPTNVALVDTLLYNISSTEIRQRLEQGQSIEHLVPKNAESLIVEAYAKREETNNSD